MDIRGTWVLPTTRESGGPLPIEEIRHTVIQASLDQGSTWTPLVNVPPGETQQFFIQDAEAGQWDFRGVVVDTNGRTANPVFGSATVPDETAPGPITEFSVTLE